MRRPHPTYWFSRRFRSAYEFGEAMKSLYLLDALRWPEDRVPRTDNPLDFATLNQRGR